MRSERSGFGLRHCHHISETVPSEIAALAEPLSCVMNGIEQPKPLAGEVAVILSSTRFPSRQRLPGPSGASALPSWHSGGLLAAGSLT